MAYRSVHVQYSHMIREIKFESTRCPARSGSDLVWALCRRS